MVYYDDSNMTFYDESNENLGVQDYEIVDFYDQNTTVSNFLCDSLFEISNE